MNSRKFKYAFIYPLFVLGCVVLLVMCKDETPEPKKSEEKKILSFKLSEISPQVVGVIDEGAKTVKIDVPHGTNVSALKPVIEISEKAVVSPASGQAVNFTNPVTYTVTAENGSQQAYVVTVTVAGSETQKSSEKKIISFRFNDFPNPVIGVIDESARTISPTVPSGTNVTALVPTIEISSKATISPASGVAQNFTNAVTYTVTAEDGTTQQYVVTVTVAQYNNSLLNNPTFGSPFPTGRIDAFTLVSNGTDVVFVIASHTTGQLYAIDAEDNDPIKKQQNTITSISDFQGTIAAAMGRQETDIYITGLEVNPISGSVYVLANSIETGVQTLFRITNHGQTLTSIDLRNRPVHYISFPYSEAPDRYVADMTYGGNNFFASTTTTNSLEGKLLQIPLPFDAAQPIITVTTAIAGSFSTSAPLETMAYGSVNGVGRLMGVVTCAPGFSFPVTDI